MIDLHTHTLFSDGVLLPSELVRRAYSAGYKALAITDHVDSSNIDFVVPRIADVIRDISEFSGLTIIPGAEITHVPPQLIEGLVKRARELGAEIVIVHGETVCEPVIKGTNRAAIEAGADILSHPGLIDKEDVISAKKKGIALEITSRKGHSLSNGYVAKTAMEIGADLVINTDMHSPEDFITIEHAKIILCSAGIPAEETEAILRNSQKIIERINKKSSQ